MRTGRVTIFHTASANTIPPTSICALSAILSHQRPFSSALQEACILGYRICMSHTIRQKKKLVNRARRIRGQVEAVERALVEELECGQILQRITACRGAIDSLLAEVLEDHVRYHIIDRHRHRAADPTDAGEEIIQVIRSYLR